MAGGADAGPAVQQVLDGVEDLVEGEAGVSAFGLCSVVGGDGAFSSLQEDAVTEEVESCSAVHLP
ncbi:hypothetical protein, partial [Streptomyces vastus]|uniref:hypothetical protein n=1 Tax=Streptomyces vastus TaxID=285451 RepID=UPI0031D2F4BB